MLHEPSLHHDVLNLLATRNGHFLLESGHHGELWLHLELLCKKPALLRPFVGELAHRLSRLRIDNICGPLVEGAFIALQVASALDVGFSYSERFAKEKEPELFPAGYRIPAPLRDSLKGQRVAISTTRSTPVLPCAEQWKISKTAEPPS